MKKLLALVLVLVLSLTALVSCQMPEPVQGVIDTVKGWLGMEVEPDEPEVTYDIPAAVEYVKSLYSADKYKVTATDYKVVSVVRVANVPYTVTWSVDNAAVKVIPGEAETTIDVNEKSDAEINYKLTATVTAGDGTTGTVTFDRQVPKFKTFSYDEFVAAEDDTAVTISGIITGIVETAKENDLYLQDVSGNGGYFVYSMAALPSELGLKVGMTVSVTGIRDTYYDLPQVTNPEVTIVDSTIKTVTPVDITDAFAAAASNDDDLFSNYFSMLVTLKGVKVLGQDTSNDSYYNFSLAGKQSYVRISSSTCMFSGDALTTFKNNVAANINNTADVVGLVSNYNNKIYIVPVDENAFSNFVQVTVTDAEKVDYELGQLTFAGSVSEDGPVNASVAGSLYNDVKISWASDNACAVVDNTAGTITFTRPASATTVKLTATLTLGDITKTKEFTVEVNGSVFDGTANLTKENMGLGGYAAGEVTVESVKLGYTELGGYDNGIQMRSKDGKTSTLFNLAGLPYGIKKIVFVYNSEKTPRIEDMLSIAFGNDANVSAYTTALTGVDGTMTYEIVPNVATYTYFKISHTATGSLYFDEINIVLDKPVEEHTCEFSTATCTQKATCSICGETQGELADHVYDATTNKCVCGKYDPEWLAIEAEMTIAEALNAPVGKKVKVAGTVTNIKEAWSSYNNMSFTITDANGDELYIFRCKTQVSLDDVVTVTGAVGVYNGVNQIAQGATAVISTTGGGDGEGEGEGEGETTAQEVTVSQLADLADGTKVIFTGTVSKITYAWSDTNKNMSVDITDGTKTINAFKLATKVGVGDVITVTGEVSSFNGTKQISAGATAVIVTAHTCTTYTDATCLTAAACTVCGTTKGEALGHNFENGVCTRTGCGIEEPTGTNVVFNFGDNKTASHVDGKDIGTAKDFTSDDGAYTLSLTNASKAYDGSIDAKGNSALKLGTSKVIGSITFNVGENVEKVIIKVAKYKANNTAIQINDGTAQTLTKNSNDGQYDEIVIDTTTTKTITISTVSGKCRAMIDSITWVLKAD